MGKKLWIGRARASHMIGLSKLRQHRFWSFRVVFLTGFPCGVHEHPVQHDRIVEFRSELHWRRAGSSLQHLFTIQERLKSPEQPTGP